MKIGYFAIGIGPLTNPAWIRTLATTVERLGFSTIWAPEHVVLVKEYASRYPYSGGDFPMPTETPIGVRAPDTLRSPGGPGWCRPPRKSS